MTNASNRHLSWDACQNARDIGGYPTEEGSVIKRGVLIRTDNLAHLTPVGRAALIDYGVRTIIDVRSPEELDIDAPPFLPPNPEPNAPIYHNLPLEVWTDPAMTIVDQAKSTAEMYCLMLDHFKANVATIVRVFAEAPDGGVVVHCHAGKDRTGLAVALLLAVAGVPQNVIAADYAESVQYLQPVYDQMVAEARGDPEKLAHLPPKPDAPPERILTVFSHLDQNYGGVAGYLQEAGVAVDTLAQVRERLFDDPRTRLEGHVGQ